MKNNKRGGICVYMDIHINLHIMCFLFKYRAWSIHSTNTSSHLHELSIKNTVQYKNNVIDETNKPLEMVESPIISKLTV